MQNNQSQEINRRFFEALDILLESGKIENVLKFCTDYGINRPNLIRLRKEPQREFQMSLLSLIVEKFNVSATWLLTGRGNKFAK